MNRYSSALLVLALCTAVLIAEASSAGVTDARFLPVQISDEGLPQEPPEEAAASLHQRFEQLAALLQRPDYESVFRERAAANLVGHETRVLFTALGRGDFSYLMTKASRVRWRHLGLLARNLRQRIFRHQPGAREGDSC